MDYNLEKEKLPKRSDQELVKLNDALMESILSGSGRGFWNGDMGHPSYRMGAAHGAEEVIDDPVWGDGPEKNGLYQLMKLLHKEMLKKGIHIEIPIKDWRDFCALAIRVYDKK